MQKGQQLDDRYNHKTSGSTVQFSENHMHGKLGTGPTEGMPATIRTGNLCLPVGCPKVWRLKYTKLQFLLFYMGLKLGLSY